MSTNLQSDLSDKLIEYLNEVLSAENAAIDRIQSRIEESSSPEAEQRLKQHLGETRAQQDRLRQIIANRGGSPTDTKAGLPTLRLPTTMMAKKVLSGMAKSVSGAGDTNPLPEELELTHTKEDYGIEQLEVISYRTLLEMCQKLGVQDAVPLLKESLQEEESMANWIAANAPTLFHLLWPKIEAAVTGVGKERTAAVAGGGDDAARANTNTEA